MPTMKAGRMNFGTGEFHVQDVAVPSPGHGEVRVKVNAAGVCLSDVHLIRGLVRPLRNGDAERTLGHEVAGTVDAVGGGVEGWTEGDRVALQALVAKPWGVDTMGVDYDGGWAEYVVVPHGVLVAIPDSLPFEQACIIPDAVSTPWAAIQHTAKVKPGEAAVVLGVGGLGIHAIQILRMSGAAPIIAVDPLPGPRENALRRGADAAFDPTQPTFVEELHAFLGNRGVDTAFNFAGFPGIDEQILPLLSPGGRLTIAGLSGNPFTVENSVALIVHQQRILGHYGYLPADVEQLVRLVHWGRLDLRDSVSAVLPLEHAHEAVRQLETKDGDPIRLVLVP
ncbi:Zn-dependent alcohol dehydrogenase [Mycolicibacterium flavescens]|uniref:zinc-binding dehydrogenase n=1 Tax=Mycobacterium neumannii TaxID=2048551 RepID=UPI000B9412B6|nr:zinc-binding dehydrogenase [Mycobacterium neumannii]VEG47110.1 Zn-dependent alcohol dehydrogenase [Mycolicibacterium flavescens]